MQHQDRLIQVHFNHHPEPRIMTKEINKTVSLGKVVSPFCESLSPFLVCVFTICLCLSCVTVLFKYFRLSLASEPWHVLDSLQESSSAPQHDCQHTYSSRFLSPYLCLSTCQHSAYSFPFLGSVVGINVGPSSSRIDLQTSLL